MYVVCRNKDDGKLFITTRGARERMVSVLIDLGQQVDSLVEKEFKTYADADAYKKKLESGISLINQAFINNKNNQK